MTGEVDLRIYAESFGGQLYHYQEVDCNMKLNNN